VVSGRPAAHLPSPSPLGCGGGGGVMVPIAASPSIFGGGFLGGVCA
jgi:hypothetical protein